LRAEIEARGSLTEATAAAAKEVRERFGANDLDVKILGYVVTAQKELNLTP
jgi:hypothetical protein